MGSAAEIAVLDPGEKRTPRGAPEAEHGAAVLLGIADADQPAAEPGHLDAVAVVGTPGALPPDRLREPTQARRAALLVSIKPGRSRGSCTDRLRMLARSSHGARPFRYQPSVIQPLRTGIVADFSIAENLALKDIEEFSQSPFGILREKKMNEVAKEAILEFSIKARGPSQVSSDLSGGNIQRLVVARELSLKSLKVLVACNPTKGVDVALTEFIRNKILDLRERGTAILLISEDLDEILAVSDRIAVLFDGKLIGPIENEKPDVKMIGQMMTGVSHG